jgi:GT2 family glycosyltransferase
VNLTERFVEALKLQTFSNYTLILIDDGSTDGTSDRIIKLAKDLILLNGDGNLWWAGSLQKGFDWIKSNGKQNSATLIINDDLVFGNDFLEKGLFYLNHTNNSFILAAAYNEDETDTLEDCGIVYDFKNNNFSANDVNNLDKLNCVSTKGLFMKTADFLKTTGFRPFLLPHYYSDYEFTIRANRKYGISLKCFLDLKIFVNTKSTGVEEVSFTNIGDYFKKAFSNRNKANPKHTFIYYLITFPFPYNFKFAFKEVKQCFNVCRSLIFR